MLKKVIIISSIVLVAVGGLLVGVDFAYAEQLLPGVTIDGQSFPGQNKTAVLDSLTKHYDSVNKQGVTLANGTQELPVTYDQTGISFNLSGAIDKAFSLSHDRIWGLGTAKLILAYITNRHNITPDISVNEQTKKDFLDATVHKQFSQTPTTASLNITDTGVNIVADKDGTWVQDDQLWSLLVASAKTHQAKIAVPIAAKQADVKPADLTTAQTETNDLINRQITLLAGTKKIAVKRADIIPWIIVKPVGDSLHAALDPEKVKAYLSSTLAPKVTQKAVDAVVSTTGDTIQTGQDGVTLQTDASVQAIMDGMGKSDQKQTITLATETKGHSSTVFDPQAGGTANLSTGKYIEISLSMQRMFLWEGGTFVNSFGVSTGKWSTPTPIGTFAIQNKIEVAYSSPYNLYMPHWNAITPDGQYGIHGLPYRGNWVEGQNHIGTPVSHGCIRLGAGNDVFVYDWAPVGTPVFIHQ